MTRPDQPAPGEDTAEGDGEHTTPGAGGGRSGDADPRDPTKDAADPSPVIPEGQSSDPEALEPPDGPLLHSTQGGPESNLLAQGRPESNKGWAEGGR